jgi:hypothetical protein
LLRQREWNHADRQKRNQKQEKRTSTKVPIHGLVRLCFHF